MKEEEKLQDEDTLQLTSFLMTYVKIDEESLLNFMKAISSLFVKHLEDVYKSIMKADHENYQVQKGNKSTIFITEQ